MKKISILFFIFICFQTSGQNLIPNPSFEDYKSCPNTVSRINEAIPWMHTLGSSADFFHECSNPIPGIGIHVPSNRMGEQPPNTGKGYAGIGIWNSLDKRWSNEYMQVKLLCPLTKGEKYEISYYISLADNSHSSIDRMGVFFSSTPTQATSIYTGYIDSIPQVISSPGSFLENKKGWELITDTFFASGGEQYMTIGNFNTNITTNFKGILPGQNDVMAYYYLDDFSLIKINTSDLGKDTTLCKGETLILNPTTPTGTYLWQDSTTNPTFTVKEKGTYWVQFDGCELTSDSIIVNFDSIPTIDIGKDTTLCGDDNIMLSTIATNVNYLWQDNSIQPTFNVTQKGIYWLEATNNCGNTSDTINISYNPVPIIKLGRDTTICSGEELLLSAHNSNSSYLWQDNSSESTFSVSREGNYWVKVLSSGCETFSDTISITRKNCNLVFIPNIFSPNGDGNNDILYVRGLNIKSFNFIIVDRWGEKMFETQVLDKGWNGYFRGKPMNNSVFMYYVKVIFADGTKAEQKGDVTLIR